MKRKAMSLVEVLIAAVVIGLAFIPLLTLTQSETHQAAFSEQQLLGRYRAKRIAEALATYGYQRLKALGSVAGGGTAMLPNPLPPVGEELKAWVRSNRSLAYLKFFEKKMSLYKEQAVLEPIEPGLVRITVLVKWKMPGETASDKEHSVKVYKLVSRRDNSFSQRHPIIGGATP